MSGLMTMRRVIRSELTIEAGYFEGALFGEPGEPKVCAEVRHAHEKACLTRHEGLEVHQGLIKSVQVHMHKDVEGVDEVVGTKVK